MRIVNFYEQGIDYTLSPTRAIEHYQAKGLRTSFAWQDMIGAEHDQAFTVAKMLDVDLLATVQDKMNKAIADGTTFQQFANDLIPQLQAAGWWGKQDVIDPLTGDVVEARLGSASRLENIFRTNMQSAYSVGEWEKIQEQKHRMPFLMYDAVDDHRTREEHAAQDEEVHPVDSPYWAIWFPPNGWQCRCGTIQMDDDDLAEYGFKVSPEKPIETREWVNPRTGKTYQVPEGIDPGWDHNPAQDRGEMLKSILAEKIEQLPKPQQVAAQTAAEGAAHQAITTALGKEAAQVEPAAPTHSNYAKLDTEQRRAVKIYSHDDYYRAINDPLRLETASAELIVFRNLLNGALDLIPGSQGISTRGLYLEGDKLAAFLQRHQEALYSKEPIQYHSYTSASEGSRAAKKGNIYVTIYGRNGKKIKPLSAHPEQEEILFKAGTFFNVERVEPKNGKWFITLVESEKSPLNFNEREAGTMKKHITSILELPPAELEKELKRIGLTLEEYKKLEAIDPEPEEDDPNVPESLKGEIG